MRKRLHRVAMRGMIPSVMNRMMAAQKVKLEILKAEKVLIMVRKSGGNHKKWGVIRKSSVKMLEIISFKNIRPIQINKASI